VVHSIGGLSLRLIRILHFGLDTLPLLNAHMLECFLDGAKLQDKINNYPFAGIAHNRLRERGIHRHRQHCRAIDLSNVMSIL
jgi:hypothetical protein